MGSFKKYLSSRCYLNKCPIRQNCFDFTVSASSEGKNHISVNKSKKTIFENARNLECIFSIEKKCKKNQIKY